jgi:hypothetical protein
MFFPGEPLNEKDALLLGFAIAIGKERWNSPNDAADKRNRKRRELLNR